MIRSLINLYILLIIIDTILYYLPQFKRAKWAIYIRKYANFSLGPVRRYMPEGLPFDFSPFVVIVIIKLLESLLEALW